MTQSFMFDTLTQAWKLFTCYVTVAAMVLMIRTEHSLRVT